MGVRNPFRIEVDIETNSLSWGDYGPDATKAVAETAGRGPMGLVEWNAISLDEPQNAGWPYVHADNQAYNDWDFATATPGAFFDPQNLKNESRWNTGLTDLPPAQPATLWYGDNPGDQPWDELVNFGAGTGQGPMGGPVYHYDESNPSTTKLPRHWDGKAFMGEFSQDYIAAFTLDWDTFEVSAIEDFLPNAALSALGQPRTTPRWTWRSGPTARCTCSTTVTASSAPTRMPACTASITSRATSRPRRASPPRPPRRRRRP